MRKRVPIIALSLANLCLLTAWRELLSPQAFSYFYYWKRYPGYALGGALAINLVVLASVFAGAYYVVQWFDRPWLTAVFHALFIAIVIRALNEFRSQFHSLSTSYARTVFGQTGYLIIAGTLFGLLGFIIARNGLQRLSRAAVIAVLVLSPLLVVCGLQALWLASTYGPRISRALPAAPWRRSSSNPARVVWILFDEMDERLSFAARPSRVSLPELDRLRSESWFAANAFPPAGHTTQSMPALLMGQLVSAVEPWGPERQELGIPALHETRVLWGHQTDVFTDALAAGFNTALVGWCIPYCRIIGDHLSFCYWEAAAQTADPNKLSFAGDLVRQQLNLLYLVPFAGKAATRWIDATKTDDRANHRSEYMAILAQAKKIVADPTFGLTFIHLPVPHPPALEDESYVGNLTVADRTFGELRQTMEEANTWERTTVIVSSDHWWRWDLWQDRGGLNRADAANRAEFPDRRIPFIMKLAGQRTPLVYQPAFNTVLTRSLIGEVLKGNLSNAYQVANWIDRHRSIAESPYHGYDQ